MTSQNCSKSFYYISHQLFETSKLYLLAVLNLKSHNHQLKLDYVPYLFTLYIFLILKVILYLYKARISILLLDLCHTQKSNGFQPFLQNIIYNDMVT